MTTEQPTAIPVPDALWDRQDSPRYETNARKAGEAGLESCTACGRGLNPATAKTLEVVDGGDVLRADLTGDQSSSGYMGAWVVGPECAKMVPAAYRRPL